MPIRFNSSSRLHPNLCIISFAALLISSASSAQVCDVPAFTTKPFEPIPHVKGTPSALIAGTFYLHNGEANCGCDLAIAVEEINDPSKDFLVILRGEDSGNFEMQPENPVLEIGENPVAMASGRFLQNRATGLDDLAVVTGKRDQPGRLTLLVAGPKGRFQQFGPGAPVGKAPRGIATGDFNGDGNLDAAVLSADTAQHLTILFGDGKGGFTAESPAIIAGVTDRRVWSLAAGKFQGNTGPDDIAIANEDAAGNVRVSIARRTPAGRFELLAPVIVGQGSDVHIANGTFGGAGNGHNDIVVAFSGINARGKAAILLDGAQALPSQDISGTPRSIKVADLNNDGHEDIIVATFSGADITNPDGKIIVYRGAAGGGINFNDRLWETRPSPILPRALVTGLFGRDQETRTRHLSIAAANAPNLNNISVYVGNGTGAFTVPSGFSTPIRPGAVLIVKGDFHSNTGDDSVVDLAYVHPASADGEHLLTVLLNNGERTFHEASGNNLRVGREPLLMIAGRFDADQALDLAEIEANSGDSQHRPRLRLWHGNSGGQFSRPPGVADFLLDTGEMPVGIATGQFNVVDTKKPSDIAVVNKTSSGGTLKLFLNNGHGQFDIRKTPLSFSPGAVMVSNKLRKDNLYDVIVKHSGSERFTFFENRGDGEFVRVEDFDQASGDAETSGQFILGDVNADGIEDVLQFDTDGTIDVFINNGSGSFTFRNIDLLLPLRPLFDPANATFFLEDFGTRQPGLIGVAKRGDGTVSILAVKGDGSGGFVEPAIDVLELPPGESLEFSSSAPHTLFDTKNIAHSERSRVDAILSSAFTGRFANALHGNEHSDLGFLSAVVKNKVVVDACPSDPQPNPGPVEQCTPADSNCVTTIRCPSSRCVSPCMPPPVCQNPPCAPAPNTCRAPCPAECTQTVRNPFCETESNGLYILVFRNTCSG